MRTTDGQGKHHRICDVSLPMHTQEPPPWNAPADPLTIAPSWVLCHLDWLAHAVDAWADHPVGVWIARCGHQLSGSTPLYDVPQGQRCARQTFSPCAERWRVRRSSNGR